jgi:hypothetical protein
MRVWDQERARTKAKKQGKERKTRYMGRLQNPRSFMNSHFLVNKYLLGELMICLEMDSGLSSALTAPAWTSCALEFTGHLGQGNRFLVQT